jgi:hypothetical protein
VSDDPVLIVQVPSGGQVSVQLVADPPSAVVSGEVVVEHEIADEDGAIEAPDAGEIVLSVPSPEAFRREPEAVHDAIAHHATGTEPLLIVVQAAEELRDDELSVVLKAARRASRPVILRVIRNG